MPDNTGVNHPEWGLVRAAPGVDPEEHRRLGELLADPEFTERIKEAAMSEQERGILRLTPAQMAALEAVPLANSITIPSASWEALSEAERAGLVGAGLVVTFYDRYLLDADAMRQIAHITLLGREAIGKYVPVSQRAPAILHLAPEQVAALVERCERAMEALRLAKALLMDYELEVDEGGWFWCPWEEEFIPKSKPEHGADCPRMATLAAIDTALKEESDGNQQG